MNYLDSKINIKMIGFGATIDYVTGKTKYALNNTKTIFRVAL